MKLQIVLKVLISKIIQIIQLKAHLMNDLTFKEVKENFQLFENQLDKFEYLIEIGKNDDGLESIGLCSIPIASQSLPETFNKFPLT